MKKKNVVVYATSLETLADVESKLEELGACIIEERYDLLYHRYEIYVKVNLRQGYKLRRFIKNRAARIVEED